MEVSYYGNFLYDILIDMYVKKKILLVYQMWKILDK